MTLEQRILDALNEAQASKTDLVWALDSNNGAVENALRRMLNVGDVQKIYPTKKGMTIEWKALRETTAVQPQKRGVTTAKIWDPVRDQKPDWLRRGEA